RGKATFQSLSRSPLEGYFNSVSIFRPDEKPHLFTQDFLQKVNGYNSISVFQKHYDNAGTDDLLTRIQYVDIKTYLPDDILVKVDLEPAPIRPIRPLRPPMGRLNVPQIASGIYGLIHFGQ